MKTAKALGLALLMIFLPLAAAHAESPKGEKTLGLKAGYITYNKSATTALAFTYRFSQHFRIAPEIGVVFRHHDSDALVADLNLHTPLTIGLPKASLYPLLGLHFSSWSQKDKVDPDGKDASKRSFRPGLNLGAGMGFRCNRTLKLCIEAKYCLVKDFQSFQVAAGLSYIF